MQINGKDVTLDDLQNGYYIYQASDEFRFGVDAVFLSEFAKVRPGEIVLDMGTGNGIIPILLAAKTKGKHFYGLEIQKNSVMIAQESVKYNDLQDRISIVRGDICTASGIFGNETMDVVVSNPPYMIAQHGLRNEADAKYIARHEALCTFEDIAREASKLLKTHGKFCLIHRPFRLAELIVTLVKYRLEPKRIRFIHSYADKEPSMVMIEALKGGNSGVRIDKPLIIYEKNGEYTPEVKEIYKTRQDLKG
jgi:tRNA1Val (adenine37-N6)-methyltransferase